MEHCLYRQAIPLVEYRALHHQSVNRPAVISGTIYTFLGIEVLYRQFAGLPQNLHIIISPLDNPYSVAGVLLLLGASCFRWSIKRG